MDSTRKVLVVDDNVDAADLTAECLRVFGMDVAVAYGGAAALASARASCPDVIFLDLGMPGVDGFQVARALRADALFEHVKIVALTAWSDRNTQEQSKLAGFNLHLTKPADLATLVDCVTGAPAAATAG
jgi:CheY-like chemotaxis protein